MGEVPERNEKCVDWTIHLQAVVYLYNDRKPEKGFRLIWRRPNGHLQAARGQARIPDEETYLSLYKQAKEAGIFEIFKGQEEF